MTNSPRAFSEIQHGGAIVEKGTFRPTQFKSSKASTDINIPHITFLKHDEATK